MDPMAPPPPHLAAGRQRYDPPFPPSHHFLAQPNYHHHHHHHHQPPPPLPPPRHHRPDRHHHRLPSDDPRLYFPFHPDPPSFDLPPPSRDPERFVIRGPEPWDPVDVRKIRVLDERPPPPPMRPDPIQLEWDREARLDLKPSFRVNPNPNPNSIPVGRRRVRMTEDGILEEDFRDRNQNHRQIRFLDCRDHHPGFVDDLVPDREGEDGYDFERQPLMRSVRSSGHLCNEIDVSSGMPMGNEIGFQGNRYIGCNETKEEFQGGRYMGKRGGNRGMEEGFQRDRYIETEGSDEAFQDNYYMGNRGKRKWINTGSEDGDGFQGNHYMGNKGKRKIHNGLNSQYFERNSPKRPVHKTSALGRIQSGISVWNRIEEKPSYFDPSSTLTTTSETLDHNQQETDAQEIDILDLSYKSNALVAKVVVPSSPSPPVSSEAKGPKVISPKMRVVKKKVVKNREKVVIPIVSGGSVCPAAAEVKPKVPVDSSLLQSSNHSESSKKALSFPSKVATSATAQSSSKRVKKVVSVNKNSAKKPAKTDGGGSITENCNQDCKVSESRPSDDTNSHLCHQRLEVVSTSMEDSDAEKSIIDANLVQPVSIEENNKEETMLPCDNIDQNSTSPKVSEMKAMSYAGTLLIDQKVRITTSPSKAISLHDNDIAENPCTEVMHAADNVGNSSHSVGTVTSSNGGCSSEDNNVRSTSERIKECHSLDDAIVVEKLAILGEGKSVTGDVLLHSDAKVISLGEGKSADDVLLHADTKDVSPLLSSEVSHLALDQTLPDGDTNKEVGVSQPGSMTIQEDSLLVSITESMSERMEPSHSRLSDKGSSVDLCNQVVEYFMDVEQSYSQLPESKSCSDINNCNNQDDKPAGNNDAPLISNSSLGSETEDDIKSAKTMLRYRPISEKMQCLPPLEPKRKITADGKKMAEESKGKKSIIISGVPRVFPNRASSKGSLKETARPSSNVKSKTWHRTDHASFASPSHGNNQRPVGSFMHKQSPKKLGKVQKVQNTSYIRKGNSLIRKSASEALAPRTSHGLDASSKKNKSLTEMGMGFGSQIDSLDRKAYFNTSFERPKTPPLPIGSKMPDCIMDPSKDINQPMPVDSTPEVGVEAQGRPLEGFDQLSGSLENQNNTKGTKSEPLTIRKRMIYVKHKSNQLVAAPPGSSDSSAHATEKSQKLSSSTLSDLYYKRKKYQLILNALSSDSQNKQETIVPFDNSNSDDQGALKISSVKYSTNTLFKKRVDKVLRKTYKKPKFSRVWTLNGDRSVIKGDTSLTHWKIAPFLFPWKRMAYRKASASSTALNSNRGSLSLMSRKLQLTRKRDTIYKVSTDGFSLRKTGVVSIGGSSLKWSKSIERHSKKANEEATLAVAEAERKKREGKRGKNIGPRGKNGHCLSRKSTFGIDLQQGERIFRVGSVRYKMDSSKRTLIRIPDEHSSNDVGQQPGNNTFVPRRLLIGNDEYIRIGNGNQLVRDPKKLIRILASEKIRWSLHTARLRLARKQQYCQFFTRFGKCNKNAGKCPYVHDPAKVAICTKFLRGKCTDANCKLTHKIIPERMPDCSYFLRGLCTNINCPYRHVHVNPNASVCDGFLRGYCANGDECRKKHSYVCPLFEATGKCLEGSKCKLHHPKSKKKSKKRKRSVVQRSSRGRYFGSNRIKAGEALMIASDKYDVDKEGDTFCTDGQFAEFISLDAGCDIDDVEANVLTDSNSKESDSDLSDMQCDDPDMLIKPVRIMNNADLTIAFGGV